MDMRGVGFIKSALIAEPVRVRAEAVLTRAPEPPLAQEAAEAGSISRLLGLISYFARSGSLPWWGDARSDRPIQHAVEDVMRMAPAGLANLVCGLTRDSVSLDRPASWLPPGDCSARPDLDPAGPGCSCNFVCCGATDPTP